MLFKNKMLFTGLMVTMLPTLALAGISGGAVSNSNSISIGGAGSDPASFEDDKAEISEKITKLLKLKNCNDQNRLLNEKTGKCETPRPSDMPTISNASGTSVIDATIAAYEGKLAEGSGIKFKKEVDGVRENFYACDELFASLKNKAKVFSIGKIDQEYIKKNCIGRDSTMGEGELDAVYEGKGSTRYYKGGEIIVKEHKGTTGYSLSGSQEGSTNNSKGNHSLSAGEGNTNSKQNVNGVTLY